MVCTLAVSFLFSTMFSTQAISLALTYNTLVTGSTDGPPHSPPPSYPGRIRVPCTEGGVKIDPARYDKNRCFNCACSALSVVMRLRSFTVMVCLANGLGKTGKGWVGDKTSLIRSVCVFTLRSSMGKTGFPVSRSKTKTMPVLVVCATASIFLPFRLMVTSEGGVGRSMSQTSWCTV